MKPYTYSYNNAQYYANDNPGDTTGLATGPNGTSGWITEAECNVAQYNASGKRGSLAPSTSSTAIRKRMARLQRLARVPGSASSAPASGYEWATSNRYQIPSGSHHPSGHNPAQLPRELLDELGQPFRRV